MFLSTIWPNLVAPWVFTKIQNRRPRNARENSGPQLAKTMGEWVSESDTRLVEAVWKKAPSSARPPATRIHPTS